MSRGSPRRLGVREFFGRGFVLVAAAAVAGCSVGPRYERPDVQVPAAWAGAAARGDPGGDGVEPAPDESGGIRAEAADEGIDTIAAWWGAFDDHILSALVEEALRSNPDARIATQRLRRARARAVVAESGRRAVVSGSGSADVNDSTLQQGAGPTTRLGVGIDAAWEADIFGGIRHGIEAAGADVAATEAALEDVRVSLVAEVARSYLETRRNQERLRIASDSIVAQSETVEMTELRARAGLVADLDVARARAALEQTRAQIPTLEAAIAELEHQLDILLGAVPGTVHAALGDEVPLPAVPHALAVGIPADVLRRRPDIRVAERLLAAETARSGAAEAALYPSLRLSGSLGVEMVSRGARGPFPGVFYSLLAGITAPIFEGGRLRAERDAQDAVREEALVAYELAVLTALRDVEDALVALDSSTDREAILDRALESADDAAALALLRYRAGLSDFQVVLDTERSRLAIADGLANARADGLVAVVELYKALGGGWAAEGAMTEPDEGEP